MTPKKSEWMQIVDSDQSSSAVRKPDKRLTLGAILGAGLIVLTGSLFANAKNEPAAIANPTVNSSTASASPTASVAATHLAAPKHSTTVKSAPTAPAPSKSTIKAPSIAQPPMGRGDDHERRDHEGGERGDD
jgi:hypothetical protein